MKKVTGRVIAITIVVLLGLALPISYSETPGDLSIMNESDDIGPIPQDSLGNYEVAVGDGHTHTNHSSGKTTVTENVAKAKERSLNWIAITDHKTVSAKTECKAETTSDFICVVGDEVSTSQGHVLAWGIENEVWWGLNASHTMNHIFEDIHKQGGLAVIAHPFAPSPDDYDFFGTYDAFDAIEIYHGYAGFNNFALSTDMDELALSKWEDYLNSGWRKTAVGDSDCHNASNLPDGGDLTKRWGAIGYPRNILYVKELSLRGIQETVRSGRLYITDGPELNFTVSDKILGETFYSDVPVTLTINVSGIATTSSDLNVMKNGTQIYTQSLSTGPFSYSFTYPANTDSWFRAEIRNPTLINGEI
ncbi:MAG: CehA/McbA family metallohydrolase, partial [Thermoplasmata archaeon]